MLEAVEGTITIRAAVTVAGDELEIDFAGTDPQHGGNLNCPLSVTSSAAYFVVRCLTAPDVPASAGAFAPVTVVAPPGSLVNALPELRSREATSRPPAGSSTCSSAHSAGLSRCPPRDRGR